MTAYDVPLYLSLRQSLAQCTFVAGINELITFLSRYYERELKKINLQANIPFEEKAFYIRKFRGKIATLKRGELVAFGD